MNCCSEIRQSSTPSPTHSLPDPSRGSACARSLLWGQVPPNKTNPMKSLKAHLRDLGVNPLHALIQAPETDQEADLEMDQEAEVGSARKPHLAQMRPSPPPLRHFCCMPQQLAASLPTGS